MLGPVQRVRRSLTQYGVSETLRRMWDYAYWKAWRFTPAARKAARRAAETDRQFDSEHRVNTGGIVSLQRFRISDPTWIHGVHYEPVKPEFFRRMLTAADIKDARSFVFIDLGAGKGRALMLASSLPFHKIVGVEFVPELVDEARQNLARFDRTRQACRDLEVVLLNAADYALPLTPTVLFLYNPFGPPLMQRVVDNVTCSLREAPRDFFVLYLNPQHDELWQKATELVKTVSDESFTIYRSKVSS